MKTILVTYDLNSPGQDYTKLLEYLKGLGAWWHHLDSTFLIKTSRSPVEIRDGAAAFIDPNDEFLVVEVTERSWASRGFAPRGTQWLRDNV